MSSARKSESRTSPSPLDDELRYYRGLVDELAGENLKLDYRISTLWHEVKQKRKGLALLTELQVGIGGTDGLPRIFEKSIRALSPALGMDRVIVLAREPGEGNIFRASQWVGISREDEGAARATTLELPADLVNGERVLLANKAAAPNPLNEVIRQAFGLPYFIALSVSLNGECLGVVVAGRIQESKPLYPPLDQSDVDILRAVAALVAASVRNMRIRVLEEMQKLQKTFFANISHEFRTPVTLTLGPLEGLRSGRYGPLDEPVQKQINLMIRSQYRLLRLINDILDLAKLEAGKMKLRISACEDVRSFLQERVDPFYSLAQNRGVRIETRFEPAPRGAKIAFDAEKMDQVLFNLLSNACKFTSSGSIMVSSAVREEHWVLSVEDTGVGIRPDQLASLFHRFFQAEGGASEAAPGTGIGLALVKELIELHGGAIRVESEYGKGTRFEARLPLGLPCEDSAEGVADKETWPAGPARGAKDIPPSEVGSPEMLNAAAFARLDRGRDTVLYVDDNPEVRAYVHDLLAPDYNVFVAADGKAGLEAARSLEPDLVLSDYMMPEMDGQRFLLELRREITLSSTPFVMLTAKSDEQSRVGGLDGGADDYLSKPFSETELKARIRNLIALRKSHQAVKRELLAARKIQQSLLPKPFSGKSGTSLEALYHPCEELSGDFYDYIESGRWLYFYLADVTSHGTAAAQVTYILKGLMRETLRRNPSLPLGELLFEVGRDFALHGLGYGICLQAMRLDLESRTLEYVTAGAPRAVKVSSAGFEVLKAKAANFLCSDEPPRNPGEFEPISLKLLDGDRIYFFTDGCYEFVAEGKARSTFGYARLVRFLGGIRPESWQDAVLGALRCACGKKGFDDDLTLLRLSMFGNSGKGSGHDRD